MKTKSKPAKRPKEPGSIRKRLQFEDGVRAALIVAAVIAVAVLGVGGFFAIRSVLSGNEAPAMSALDAVPDEEPRIIPDYPAEIFSTPDQSVDTASQPDQAAPPPPVSPPPVPPSAPPPASPPPASPPPSTPSASAPAAASPAQPARTTPAPAAAPARPAAPVKPSQNRGVLVLVIDDAGNNLRDLDPFLKFPGPITIAVLPGLANSVEAARRVRAAGKELFLHQPMEPLNGQNPGPGAIKTGMTPAQVKEVLLNNFNEIGPIKGFNNHEGSRATMDPAIMRPILEISRDSGILFLDSRTTADTAAPQVARQLGVPIAERDIFLDNEQDRASILAALEAGCKRAEQNGKAILIGHAWSPGLAAILNEIYPQLIQKGYVFATVTSVSGWGK